MKISVEPSDWEFVRPLRERYRLEMGCQVVHDSLHERLGWTNWFKLKLWGLAVGYAASVSGGPWTGTTTIFELYVLPEYRHALLEVGKVYLEVANVDRALVQSNDPTMSLLMYQYFREIEVEKVVFASGYASDLPADWLARHVLAHVSRPAKSMAHL